MAGEASETKAATYPRGFSQDTDWKWPMVPTRKLVALNYGRALKADTRSPGKVPVFGTNGQCGLHDAPLAKGPGLILGRKGQGPLGVKWCDKDFWVIDTAYYVSTLTPDVDLKYLFHLVKYVGLNHLKDGTSNPTLSRDTFGAQLFPLPPLAVQKAIVGVLGALDDKIELNRRMNATLESMARALFQSWFVDFDPVRAKLDGHQPVGMDRATAELFPSSFQESPLGPIPHGWLTAQLEEIASVSSGRRPEGRCDALSPECNIPLYGGGGRMGYVPTPLYDKPILFTGRVGTLGLIFRTAEPSWPSDNTLIVEPQADLFDFTYFVLKGFDLITLNRGSTQPLLTQSDLKRQTLVLPTKVVIKAFAEVSEPIFRQMSSNERESRTLATLRDTLLPKLLSGELIL
jgi:type I restriction enzyme S subunit